MAACPYRLGSGRRSSSLVVGRKESNSMAMHIKPERESRLPVIELLHPREQTRTVVALLVVGLILWGLVVSVAGWPIWGATSVLLGVLLVPGVQKWRSDLLRYGSTVMVLSILLVMQGFHSVEHGAQWL